MNRKSQPKSQLQMYDIDKDIKKWVRKHGHVPYIGKPTKLPGWLSHDKDDDNLPNPEKPVKKGTKSV
jgi:hypothetical protein